MQNIINLIFQHLHIVFWLLEISLVVIVLKLLAILFLANKNCINAQDVCTSLQD